MAHLDIQMSTFPIQSINMETGRQDWGQLFLVLLHKSRLPPEARGHWSPQTDASLVNKLTRTPSSGPAHAHARMCGARSRPRFGHVVPVLRIYQLDGEGVWLARREHLEDNAREITQMSPPPTRQPRAPGQKPLCRGGGQICHREDLRRHGRVSSR